MPEDKPQWKHNDISDLTGRFEYYVFTMPYLFEIELSRPDYGTKTKEDWNVSFCGQSMAIPPMPPAKAKKLALQYVKGFLLEALEPLKGVRAKKENKE